MYTITLSPQQLAVINAALQEMPFKIVAPLVDDLNRQLSEAENAKAAQEEKPADIPPQQQQ